MNFFSRNLHRSGQYYSGMTILELQLAIAMLVVFTGAVAMVMEVTLRFYGPAKSIEQNGVIAPKGVLIDHGQLHIAMDTLVEVLSQPGVSLNGIAFTKLDKPGIACTDDPQRVWKLQNFIGKNELRDLLPPSYRLCLLKTTVLETATTPGIYLLQALPEQRSPFALPIRRLFCRPLPHC